MTERTITSDEVRCPKCYSNDEMYAKSHGVECRKCGCIFEYELVHLFTCTEVPND